MTTRAACPRLRLIIGGRNDECHTSEEWFTRQLELPYPEPSAVLLAYTDALVRDEFISLLHNFAPRSVIDLRVVPTFDVLAGSRSYAFRIFDSLNAHYFDVFGQLNAAMCHPEQRPDWQYCLAELLEAESHAGPYLFLFSDLDLLSAAESALPCILRDTIGQEPKVSIVAQP